MIERSESIKELATALAKAQMQFKVAVKDSNNPHFRSTYADLASIWAACREGLNGNGLSVVQLPTDAPEGRVALKTMLLHSSGEFIASVASTRILKDDPQGLGYAVTYLRRYALAAAVGIVADDQPDDDANAASAPPPTQRGVYRQQQPKPSPAPNTLRPKVETAPAPQTAAPAAPAPEPVAAAPAPVAAPQPAAAPELTVEREPGADDDVGEMALRLDPKGLLRALDAAQSEADFKAALQTVNREKPQGDYRKAVNDAVRVARERVLKVQR